MITKQYFNDGKLVCDCSLDEKNRRHGDYRSWYTNGRKKAHHIYKFGVMLESKRYHDDESNGLMLEYRLMNGLRHGECLVYYPSGVIHKRIRYNQGERAGPTKIFNELGSIVRQINYPSMTMGLGKLSYKELRDLCAKYKLPKSGSKDRMVEYIDNELKSSYN